MRCSEFTVMVIPCESMMFGPPHRWLSEEESSAAQQPEVCFSKAIKNNCAQDVVPL